MGCQATMPTRLVWPSRVTTGSRRGRVRPPSGISHTCREGADESLVYPKLWMSPPPAPSPRLCAHHDGAVLRATGNDIVIVRAPGDVQHGGRVATDCRCILVHSTSLEDIAGALTLKPSSVPCSLQRGPAQAQGGVLCPLGPNAAFGEQGLGRPWTSPAHLLPESVS